jgi:hypothetical protein
MADIDIGFDVMKNRFYEIIESDPAGGVSSRKKLGPLGPAEEAEVI